MLQNINILEVINIALKAGSAVMQVYRKDFTVEYKDDKSPLTEADKRAHKIIVDGLSKISPFPTLSEEGKNIPYEERKKWQYYWLIDPIDGTKEFIKKNDEFTINIALIHKDTPVLGVVLAPAINELYYAKKEEGAYKVMLDDECWMLDEKDLHKAQKLPLNDSTSNNENSTLTIVASKSHLNQETQEFIDKLTSNTENSTFISKGSSLKLLMVAEGSADVYPRLAPTMEWDTAAADAVVRESGKMTYEYNQQFNIQNSSPLKYNKEDLLNPWFVVK
ncbi:3'(2'),5'-bisphosphate nucleotidase CysQ [Hydrogenimonas thermophila]|uniref:3'(2'),5'-bisphosphate nucleotidase CysQ n=1 Tax=Hydrogenimonas thermophila TaxID=223786 RepID=UPI002936FF0F|nr:3'(2'),5'-bisphosphate nucleotidase CysQ [Hydrogenimonas thermophila]WOE71217.1 3'(2'),5'-bisphosphate nucleotidase CysQ [Hydrogenimonas thermophila]WOE73737.1 3'(2'),5'-bisphosphate nucleotidase CysQ [Hydrogenimonas thermophila]